MTLHQIPLLWPCKFLSTLCWWLYTCLALPWTITWHCQMNTSLEYANEHNFSPNLSVWVSIYLWSFNLLQYYLKYYPPEVGYPFYLGIHSMYIFFKVPTFCWKQLLIIRVIYFFFKCSLIILCLLHILCSWFPYIQASPKPFCIIFISRLIYPNQFFYENILFKTYESL